MSLPPAVRSYLLLVRWEFLRRRQLVVMFVLLQVALGVGIVYGFAFLVPQITPTVAVFLATGAMTITLTLLGLVAVPQEVALARVSGRQGYLDALPVPRLAPLLSELTFAVLMQLPGAVATLALAAVRFHLHLQLSPLVLPAAALTALTAAALGCAIAVSLPPNATQQVTQFLSVGLLLFSPVAFPMSRLPAGLQDLHRGLPVAYMADIMRGTITGHYDTSRLLAFGVVMAWCVAGLATCGRAAARRH
ncbi:MAG TPA: ABC transporter permease [Acidimicrobiales bacterium]|nr:ABC transporter permease [Acidimicrobiales bacterium]